MTNILVVESSPRGTESFSKKLGMAIVAKIKFKDTHSVEKIRDLATQPFPHLEEATLNAFYTPPEKHTEEHKKAVEHSNAAIAEIMAADVIVIEVPMYNFGIPSVLKAWVDHVCRAGITFRYSEKGPVGLVAGKKVFLAIASGGLYQEGPMKEFDFTESYLRTVLGFIGLTDIQAFRVEGLAIPGIKEHALEKVIASINSV